MSGARQCEHYDEWLVTWEERLEEELAAAAEVVVEDEIVREGEGRCAGGTGSGEVQGILQGQHMAHSSGDLPAMLCICPVLVRENANQSVACSRVVRYRSLGKTGCASNYVARTSR